MKVDSRPAPVAGRELVELSSRDGLDWEHSWR
jgi:hypothetical protein